MAENEALEMDAMAGGGVAEDSQAGGTVNRGGLEIEDDFDGGCEEGEEGEEDGGGESASTDGSDMEDRLSPDKDNNNKRPPLLLLTPTLRDLLYSGLSRGRQRGARERDNSLASRRAGRPRVLLFGCCSTDRIALLAKFFLFHFLLLAADIVTDFIGGVGLLYHGHIYWGAFTLILPFFPSVAFCLGAALNLNRQPTAGQIAQEERPFVAKTYLLQAAFHLPFMQPCVNFLLFLRLVATDTDDSRYSKDVEKIQRKAGRLGFYEAFLEAGPQFILQLSIVMRFGFITKTQALSMPISFLSLCLASAKAYHHQRMEPLADPNPPFAKNLALVLPPYLVIVFTNVCTWAVIIAHVRAFGLLFLLGSLLHNWIVLSVFRIEKSLKQNGTKRSRIFEAANLKWNAVFTSVLSPCVVGNHRSNLLAVSGLSSTLCLGLWLQATVLIVQERPPNMAGNPPITFCFQDSRTNASKIEHCYWDLDKEADNNATGILVQSIEDGINGTLHLCHSWVSLCSKSCWQPLVRICGDSESPSDILLLVLVPYLNVMLMVSFLLCCLLQVLSDYANVFKLTHLLTFRRGGILHRSLVCSLVEFGDGEELGNILTAASSGDKKEAVNRPDSEGDFPLHIACRKGHERCVRVLLMHAASPRVDDPAGRTPLHVAAASGRASCLAPLAEAVQRRRDIDAEDANGLTPLDLALRRGGSGGARCARILVTHPRNSAGSAPLDGADERRRRGANLLHLACMRTNERSVESILWRSRYPYTDCAQSNLDPASFKSQIRQRVMDMAKDTDGAGMTPFHYAAKHGRLENLVYLLSFLKPCEEDVDVEFPTARSGLTPLHMALGRRDLPCCRIIIDYLSVPKAKFVQDWTGVTRSSSKVDSRREVLLGLSTSLLQYAVYRQSATVCTILLDYHESHSAPWETAGCLSNSKGEIDFQVVLTALKVNSAEVLKLLLDHLLEKRKDGSKGLIGQNAENISGFKSLIRQTLEENQLEILRIVLGSICEDDDSALKKVVNQEVVEMAVANSSRECCELVLDCIEGDFTKGENSTVAAVSASLRKPWLLQLCVSHKRADLLEYILRQEERHLPEEVSLARLLDGFKDERGRTLVHWASARGHNGCLEVLLRAGAAVSPPSSEGERAIDGEAVVLFDVVKGGHSQALTLLLERLLKTYGNGAGLRSALERTLIWQEQDLGRTAALRGHFDCLEAMSEAAPGLLGSDEEVRWLLDHCKFFKRVASYKGPKGRVSEAAGTKECN